MSRFLRIGEIIINPKWISYMSINAQGCKIRIAPMEIDGWWIAGSGSVQSDFKYEVEVKALIREATEPLNQRIFALEMINQRLELEVNTLRHAVYNDIQRLEKRITDFTDVWHPIMTENINRIKTDLEKTIIETERKDIKNIQEELESKLINIIDNKIGIHIKENDNEKFLQDNFNSYKNTYSIKLSDLAKRLNDKYNCYGRIYESHVFKLVDIYEKQINVLDEDNNILIINIQNNNQLL